MVGDGSFSIPTNSYYDDTTYFSQIDLINAIRNCLDEEMSKACAQNALNFASALITNAVMVKASS